MGVSYRLLEADSREVLIIAGRFVKRRRTIRSVCSAICVASVLCAQGELAQGIEIPGMYQDLERDHPIGALRNQGTTQTKGVEALRINFKQISRNITAMTRTASNIQYIAIHDTANPRPGANAEMHFQFFNNAYRASSADFFVDDKQILQINDWRKYYTWAVGDGNGRFCITNRNSVSIEICVNSDSNYNTAFNKTVELTRHLMNLLNVPAERVVRHYDASRKPCPGTMMANNWARWTEFKSLIGGGIPVENPNITLQKSLHELGYPITIDGIVGPQTRSFVTDFQRVMGLNPDGVYGPITREKLQQIMSNEKLIIIYRNINILSRTHKKGQDPIIIDRPGWIQKAANDTGVYWIVRKFVDYVT